MTSDIVPVSMGTMKLASFGCTLYLHGEKHINSSLLIIANTNIIQSSHDQYYSKVHVPAMQRN